MLHARLHQQSARLLVLAVFQNSVAIIRHFYLAKCFIKVMKSLQIDQIIDCDRGSTLRWTILVDFLPLKLIIGFSRLASWSSWCPSGGSRRACGPTTSWTWSSSTQQATWTCCLASRTCSAGKRAFPPNSAVQPWVPKWYIEGRSSLCCCWWIVEIQQSGR